ncbi:hypothetical protein OAJ84_03520, partial [Candidatus Puniceispirillum sp.]|nr:hypothetical protein [Candidatus Puniceispirillum sp.]
MYFFLIPKVSLGAEDSVTIVLPDNKISVQRLERGARLILLNRIGMQRIKFVWPLPFALSDALRKNVEKIILGSMEFKYDIDAIKLKKFEPAEGSLTFYYSFVEPPHEIVRIQKSTLPKIFLMAQKMHNEERFPTLIELALQYPDLITNRDLERLWKKSLPNHSYNAVFERAIISADAIKFALKDIIESDLPETVADTLRLFDLAPTNQTVCSHTLQIAEKDYPQITALMRPYCLSLNGRLSNERESKDPLLEEINRLQEEFDINLRENPIIYFLINSGHSFNIAPTMAGKTEVLQELDGQDVAIAELFNHLPRDGVNLQKTQKFEELLHSHGFRAIPKILQTTFSNKR